MNQDQIIALVNAGYSKSEIDAMSGSTQTKPETPKQEKKEEKNDVSQTFTGSDTITVKKSEWEAIQKAVSDTIKSREGNREAEIKKKEEITQMTDQMKQMLEVLSGKGIDIPKTESMDDKLAKWVEELTK